jgi:GNAT superfamily N-acetyltransferase
LLPAGWRPDRDGPPDDDGNDGGRRRRAVIDADGRIRLGNGTAVLLRPLRPDHGRLLAQGFERLSPRSRYQRFLAPVPRLTDAMLAFLTSVDDVDHRAFGAVVDEGPGKPGTTPAGVVRWVRTKADPVVADLAVTVIDDYQGRGLGGLLLDVAVLDALAHGVERFEGVVLGENVSSRRMLARAGATFQPEGGGVLAFRLPLAPRAEALRRSPLPAVIAPPRLPTATA